MLINQRPDVWADLEKIYNKNGRFNDRLNRFKIQGSN